MDGMIKVGSIIMAENVVIIITDITAEEFLGEWRAIIHYVHTNTKTGVVTSTHCKLDDLIRDIEKHDVEILKPAPDDYGKAANEPRGIKTSYDEYDQPE